MAEITTPRPFTYLTAISTVDGRFRGKIENLSNYFSEFAMCRNKVRVEIAWLLLLSKYRIIRELTKKEKLFLEDIANKFSQEDAQVIWEEDLRINHDVKAIELFIAGKLKNTPAEDITNFIHFGLTSTDTDNISFTISLQTFLLKMFYPLSKKLLEQLRILAVTHKNTPMLARTHGVPALPTTVGKEIINIAVALKDAIEKIKQIPLSAKVSGAVGNRNEMNVIPSADWKSITEEFIRSFALIPQVFTTQIESHSDQVSLFDALSQFCRIGKKLTQDLWLYNALGYLAWKDEKGHVGSSVMPHKINPIGAELADTYFHFGKETLYTISNIIMENRLQRDLRDKYALRKTGEALAEIVLAADALTQALKQIGFNKQRLLQDLNSHWEILSAPVQTILRMESIPNPYEVLKQLSRGNVWTETDYYTNLEKLDLPIEVRKKLKQLSPPTLLGEAVPLTEKGIKEINDYIKK